MSESVLIGFCDGRVPKKQLDQLTNESNFIGYQDSTLRAREHLHLCGKCLETRNTSCILHFLLQIYCPLEASFHRTLLIYQCSARGNFEVFRYLKRLETESQNKTDSGMFAEESGAVGFGEDDAWGDDDEDDWGCENEETDAWGDDEPKSTPKTLKTGDKKSDSYFQDDRLVKRKNLVPVKNRYREF